ncbi:MAG: NFACT family protein [Oscillospiraceae bacterium]|nr:NFACT family protein [Oscillospiraceae bacterium]
MPLDGLYLHFLKHEIEEKALGARVDKIVQPSREELIFHLRGKEGTHKLLLCGSASNPRLHFVEETPENPKEPPMFCMLLRKRLGGGRLTGIQQVGLDRILHLEFSALNELGDAVGYIVAIEIMGRHSNVIAMDQNGKILDSLRRVDAETSRVRQILPGLTYCLPPSQHKHNLLDSEVVQVVDYLRTRGDIPLDKALADNLEGFSALACREAVFYVTRGAEVPVGSLTDQQADRLFFYLKELQSALAEGKPNPTMILEKEGRPRDFSCMPVNQYGTSMMVREFPGCSGLLERFFAERDRIERIRQRSGDLLTMLASASDRVTRRVAAQREELLQCAERESLKQMGDLISANLFTIHKGEAKTVVQNFYDPEGGEIVIQLDPLLTPTQNAQRYYTLYRKADTAEKHLSKLITQGEEEIVYLDSVFDALTRAAGGQELEAIRLELAGSGYLRRAAAKKGGKAVRPQKLSPLRYRSSDGLTILCGRNNVQNDALTLKEAGKTDLWLHTKNIPGSHVIVLTEGRQVPDATIRQAAIIAAYNSKGRESAKVAVDYTQIKNVRKPGGSKPGMVIYDYYKTILVDPDEEVVRELTESGS